VTGMRIPTVRTSKRVPGMLEDRSVYYGSIPENQSSIPLTGRPAGLACLAAM
jgi:hypothetical protein